MCIREDRFWRVIGLHSCHKNHLRDKFSIVIKINPWQLIFEEYYALQ